MWCCVGSPRGLIEDEDGPKPTSTVSYDTAPQLRKTGHSFISKHFEMASEGCARPSCRSPRKLSFRGEREYDR